MASPREVDQAHGPVRTGVAGSNVAEGREIERVDLLDLARDAEFGVITYIATSTEGARCGLWDRELPLEFVPFAGNVELALDVIPVLSPPGRVQRVTALGFCVVSKPLGRDIPMRLLTGKRFVEVVPDEDLGLEAGRAQGVCKFFAEAAFEGVGFLM